MSTITRAANAALWTAQGLLTLLFLFAGGAKLAMPLAPVAALTGLPVAFLQFIAVAEIAGALGLILPGLLRIRRELTPLAAIGLVGVMTGAVVVTVGTQGVGSAVPPAIVGLLLIAVIRGRRGWARPAAQSYQLPAAVEARAAA